MPQTPLPPNLYKKMKKVKFIHPITGESHELMCDKVEGYEQRAEFYHHCTVDEKTVALIPMSWAMMRIE